MDKKNLDMIILISMLTTPVLFIALLEDLWLCDNKIRLTISANIDITTMKSHCDNIIYTDWKRDFLRQLFL